MLDIGWSEMLVVGAIALIVIGPKDLPAALRQAGKWMGMVRRMASDFQGQVNQAMKEAELDELRREVNNLKSGMGGITDPIRTAGNEVKAAVEARPQLPAPEPAPAAPSEPEAPPAIAAPATKAKSRAPRKKPVTTETKT